MHPLEKISVFRSYFEVEWWIQWSSKDTLWYSGIQSCIRYRIEYTYTSYVKDGSFVRWTVNVNPRGNPLPFQLTEESHSTWKSNHKYSLFLSLQYSPISLSLSSTNYLHILHQISQTNNIILLCSDYPTTSSYLRSSSSSQSYQFL